MLHIPPACAEDVCKRHPCEAKPRRHLPNICIRGVCVQRDSGNSGNAPPWHQGGTPGMHSTASTATHASKRHAWDAEPRQHEQPSRGRIAPLSLIQATHRDPKQHIEDKIDMKHIIEIRSSPETSTEICKNVEHLYKHACVKRFVTPSLGIWSRRLQGLEMFSKAVLGCLV